MEEWTKACFADYEDYRARWGPIEAEARKTLDSMRGRSFYEALETLRDLYAGLQAKAHSLGLNDGVSYISARDDGIAFEIAGEIARLQRAHGATFTRYFQPRRFQRAHAVTGRPEFDRNHKVRHAEQLTSCRKTDRIRRIWPDGRVEYDSECTTTRKPVYL